ncbi:Inner membrane ABC transporter permease protein YdcV [Clostridiales bacterium CHKCI006]|uniref:ABC transporter permease n=1 Tax=Candidatus Fimiplasma intestinipullorum TaxID=2840825 RepID=A0A9D1HMB5_9FIRM|nr:Inner membrane ABC transporter permease protein YdcV [Clostridiales bacterium CHKCI006]HIU13056.1 ABC transporter permease [Candidatus Fimiplasma intestinipullorum]
MRKNRFLGVWTVLVFAFLLLPLVIVTITAFGEANVVQFPIQGFTFKWFGKALSSNSFMSACFYSLRLALVATLLALLVGIPGAYALARYSIKGKQLIKSFFLSPTIVPGTVLGFALFQVIVVQLQIPYDIGLLFGHFLIVLPYVIRIVGSSLEQFDFSIEEAAWTLGCGKIKTFFTIVLPNITSGISSAFLLAFINSFNNVPVSMFLIGPGTTTLPATLMGYLESGYDPTVPAFSVLMMLATIGIMFVVEKTLGIAALSK